VVILHPGGALDLDQPAGAAAALQDVGAHEHVERLAGLSYRGIEVGDVRDQAAFGMQMLRGPADPIPLRHPIQDGLALLCELAPVGL
jgi:hypothetical protein